MGKINSRAKGARGERLARDLLKKYGFEARRGKQYSGDAEAPDVIHDIPDIHLEVKFVEKLNIRKALEQATKDSKGTKIPVVMHKTKNSDWLATMNAEYWLDLERIICQTS